MYGSPDLTNPLRAHHFKTVCAEVVWAMEQRTTRLLKDSNCLMLQAVLPSYSSQGLEHTKSPWFPWSALPKASIHAARAHQSMKSIKLSLGPPRWEMLQVLPVFCCPELLTGFPGWTPGLSSSSVSDPIFGLSYSVGSFVSGSVLSLD